jgi:hypothetical protein
MPCEKNLFDAAPVSLTPPDDDDYLLFALPDKTFVWRSWGIVKQGLVPEDFEQVVVDGNSADVINTGDGGITLNDFAGHRVRLIRGGIPQPKDPALGYYYTWDIGTGAMAWSPAAQKGELFQIIAY